MKRFDPMYPNLTERCMKATDSIAPPLQHLVWLYLNKNMAARWYLDARPRAIIDHVALRTRLALQQKALPFVLAGWKKKAFYEYEADGWIAAVYVREGQTALFVDSGEIMSNGLPDPYHLISKWVLEFPEQHSHDFLPHHIAVRVDDIYDTVQEMEFRGFPFSRKLDGSYAILSGYDGKLKQIFSRPEMLMGEKSKKMVVGTVFELIQRDPSLNAWDFIKAQASELMMKQSVAKE